MKKDRIAWKFIISTLSFAVALISCYFRSTIRLINISKHSLRYSQQVDWLSFRVVSLDHHAVNIFSSVSIFSQFSCYVGFNYIVTLLVACTWKHCCHIDYDGYLLEIFSILIFPYQECVFLFRLYTVLDSSVECSFSHFSPFPHQCNLNRLKLLDLQFTLNLLGHGGLLCCADMDLVTCQDTIETWRFNVWKL